MGRPKLPRTKEQIAIRLAPGTKARLSSLLRSIAAAGGRPVRSEVLREAIERGLGALENELGTRAVAQPAPVVTRPARANDPPPRARPAPPPPRIPAPAASHPVSSARRAPIPGTLADRALQRLETLRAQGHAREVPLPQLCREAWPPNPARVRDAVTELADLGLVELLPMPSGTRATASDQDLMLRDAARGSLGIVRLR
jgi:predicted DNA-binding protein